MQDPSASATVLTPERRAAKTVDTDSDWGSFKQQSVAPVQEPAGQGDPVYVGPVGGAGEVSRGRSVRDRYESCGERDPAVLRRETELALHQPPGRLVARCSYLQPADHCASISVGSGGLAI